tara:strand:- start:347 stop:937 length:591 start_codon:yes stop_codon:yes gene_type:complete
MALTDKKYTRLFSTGGSDDDNVSSDLKNKFKADFDANNYLKLPNMNGTLSPVLHILQNLTEEIDYLRTEISTNKDKTGISNSQASAITANTAKTGITLQEQKDISNNKAEIANNVSEISNNKRSIVLNNAAAINVGAYPPLPPFAQLGTTQSHGSEIVYDKIQKKYFLNIYYVEDIPGLGGKKGQRIIRTGQVELI